MTATFLPILIALLALLAHALLAAFEAAFSAVDGARLRTFAEDERNRIAWRLSEHIQHPTLIYVTLLFGLLISAVVTLMAAASATPYVWVSVPLACLSLIVVGELLPRTLALRNATRALVTLFPIVNASIALLAVVAWPLSRLDRAFRKLCKAPPPEVGPFLSSEEEFLVLVDESAASGDIEKVEQEMIHSVLNLQDTQAREIMVPRTDIKSIPDTATRTTLIALFEETGLTRIPIFHESLDTIIGVANAYDVLLDTDPENEDIRRFARTIVDVPDTLDAGDVMEKLKLADQHMAIVTDEYGGTDGIITLEDTLEEIFGEIHDEHDRAPDRIRQVGPRGYVVDARMPLEEVEKYIGVDMDAADVETIGGWVMKAAGRILAQGEKIRKGGFRVTVLEGKSHQINKIRLDILDEAEPPGNQSP